MWDLYYQVHDPRFIGPKFGTEDFQYQVPPSPYDQHGRFGDRMHHVPEYWSPRDDPYWDHREYREHYCLGHVSPRQTLRNHNPARKRACPTGALSPLAFGIEALIPITASTPDTRPTSLTYVNCTKWE